MAPRSISGRAPVLSGVIVQQSTIPQAVDDLIQRLAVQNAEIISHTVSEARALVEWRFGDGDPEAPAIRSSFIRRAEAEATVKEGGAHILAARGLC